MWLGSIRLEPASCTVLLIRGLLSPSGHAAWNGFVCAVLWCQRQLSGHPFGPLVIRTFLVAVGLHTLWDLASLRNVQTTPDLILNIVFLVVLMGISLSLIIWRFHHARKFALKAYAAPQ